MPEFQRELGEVLPISFFSPSILFLDQSCSLSVLSSWSLEKDPLLHSRNCFDWAFVWDALPLCPLGLEIKYCPGTCFTLSCPHRVFHSDDGHPPSNGGPLPPSSHFGCIGTMEETPIWNGRTVIAKAKQSKGQLGSFSRSFYLYGCPYFSTGIYGIAFLLLWW